MRGSDEKSGSLFSYVDLEDRIPARAFPVNIESLVRCLSLCSNAKSDNGRFNENWKRFNGDRMAPGPAIANTLDVYRKKRIPYPHD